MDHKEKCHMLLLYRQKVQWKWEIEMEKQEAQRRYENVTEEWIWSKYIVSHKNITTKSFTFHIQCVLIIEDYKYFVNCNL